ncbi:carboxypeptidase regulatory-like domain-containing protein [Enterovirga aerilata]|uniref:Carboxypeptidase regulatory-like domain-containing protein n=1 Tax=Enterovirga aerilata TaxID=2730920 RepID=A0A849I4C4_9HYPH|nr:carboxypeptidase regulatory-like domain-containing protein [Enterovirga sp. DB1703]NNM72534.1 carboxypeptidase regulatory-like domain-containing protein [Enterovirga sp. DB1703]
MGPAVPIGAAFDPRSAEYILKSGRGRIDGQAFLRRDYGRLVTAAGERVFLIPATSYAVERFDRMFGGDRRSYYGNPVEDPPPEYLTYRRETKVDMTGRFAFENLAPGRYIVATRVFWTEPKSFFTHGGAMYDTVEVKDDETTTAIISGK